MEVSMKMVKSLLLGSAAGLIAVAGAQAADLAVKAKPVEYVKICDLYGAGFYYVPGTDICVKIGGYVRGQYFVGGYTGSPMFGGRSDIENTRSFNSANDFRFRARAIMTMDSRSPTPWGTVRTYAMFGWNLNSPAFNTSIDRTGETFYTRRAFIQWAGFTFGRAQSFFDVFPQGSFTYWSLPTHDTGDPGHLLAAYTAMWGNGISTTISAEAPRRHGVLNTDTAGVSVFNVSGNVNNDVIQERYPDFIGNLRIDQAWGTFQVAGALHDASAAYWFADGNNRCTTVGTSLTGAQECGYPGDKWGYAVSVGATIKLPFIAPKDRVAFQVNFSEGAYRYVNNISGGNPGWFGGNYSLGAGWGTDAVLRDNVPGVRSGSLELTEAWGFIAAYEHFWTPYLRTSWYGGAYEVDYNANANNWMCNNILGGPGGGAIQLVNAAGVADRSICDNNHGVWFVGSRTQWNIRPDFYMGVDVLYQKLETAHDGALAYYNDVDARPGRAIGPYYKLEDQEALVATFRVHRSIVP